VKKAFPIILFFTGLVIQLAALFGEHATEIHFVLRYVAPSYCHAVAGEQILAGSTVWQAVGLDAKNDGA